MPIPRFFARWKSLDILQVSNKLPRFAQKAFDALFDRPTRPYKFRRARRATLSLRLVHLMLVNGISFLPSCGKHTASRRHRRLNQFLKEKQFAAASLVFPCPKLPFHFHIREGKFQCGARRVIIADNDRLTVDVISVNDPLNARFGYIAASLPSSRRA